MKYGLFLLNIWIYIDCCIEINENYHACMKRYLPKIRHTGYRVFCSKINIRPNLLFWGKHGISDDDLGKSVENKNMLGF